MPSFLTRRVSFAAAHRYRIADWSDERNAAVFGACARPNYHGHSYVCEVTVTGEIDPVTGFLVDLGLLDDWPLADERRRPGSLQHEAAGPIESAANDQHFS